VRNKNVLSLVLKVSVFVVVRTSRGSLFHAFGQRHHRHAHRCQNLGEQDRLKNVTLDNICR